MDLISEAAFTEELRRDLDITFVGNVTTPLTLRPGDTLNVRNGTVEIIFHSRTPVERITCERRNILWYSLRERMHRTPLRPSPPSAAAPSGNSARESALTPAG